MLKNYEYQSPFAKKYVAEGRMQGRAEGLLEGRIEGRIEGRMEGRIEGRTEAAARAVLTVLQARGIVVPDTERERILSQKDLEQLERWLKRAAVSPSVTEIIDEAN